MKAAELVPLGRTGVMVSRFGLGLASLGGMFAPVPQEQAIATIDRAWELGVRLFDTAPVYGYGRSETYAGQALGRRSRAAYTLCTKVGRLIEPGGPDTQPIWADPPPGLGPRLDYSYPAVLRSVADSLDRLGLERVDVLHVHDPDEDYPAALAGAYAALADLRAAGRIGAVSLGVNHADVAARFIREAPAPGPDCVLLAGRYTLLDQSALTDLLPLCQRRGVAVMAAGVFQGGALVDPDAAGGLPPATRARLEAIRATCVPYGVPVLAAALRFPFRHPAVETVVVGARTPEEVAGSVALLDHPVPEELWRSLAADGLIPGPS